MKKLFSRKATDLNALEKVLADTHLSVAEATELQKRFERHFPSMSPTKSDLLSELAPNPPAYPVLSRIFDLYCSSPTHPAKRGKDSGNPLDARMDFVSFARLVSVFSPNAPMDEKLLLLFRVFDIECKGFITATSIQLVLKAVTSLSGIALTDAQIAHVAKETVRRAAKSGAAPGAMAPPPSEGIDLTQFKQMFLHCPIVLESVTIPLWNLVETSQMDTNRRQIDLSPRAPSAGVAPATAIGRRVSQPSTGRFSRVHSPIATIARSLGLTADPEGGRIAVHVSPPSPLAMNRDRSSSQPVRARDCFRVPSKASSAGSFGMPEPPLEDPAPPPAPPPAPTPSPTPIASSQAKPTNAHLDLLGPLMVMAVPRRNSQSNPDLLRKATSSSPSLPCISEHMSDHRSSACSEPTAVGEGVPLALNRVRSLSNPNLAKHRPFNRRPSSQSSLDRSFESSLSLVGFL